MSGLYCIQTICQSNKVVLTCNKDNSIALHLYYEFGFRETGNEDEDEIELALLL